MSAGITTQYGFLFQRLTFIYTIVSELSINIFYTYEGVDDIDVDLDSNAENLSMIIHQCEKYIQVKSGNVSLECWAKVVGNWILTENSDSKSFLLFCENCLPFDVKSEDTVKKVHEYFASGKEKRKSSIARRVYDKLFLSMSENDIQDKITTISMDCSIKVMSYDQIMGAIRDNFISNYCGDIKTYNRAKNCRFDRFMDYMMNEIDEAIAQKNKCVITFKKFMDIVGRVRSEISDERYSIDISDIKKTKMKDAEELVRNCQMREIEQLRLVNPNVRFVANELVNELMYKDFREVYCDVGYEISNMEEIASSNYRDVLVEVGEDASAKTVYCKTIEKDIHSPLVDNSPIYRKGCYIYLTGESIDADKQITWGCNNE